MEFKYTIQEYVSNDDYYNDSHQYYQICCSIDFVISSNWGPSLDSMICLPSWSESTYELLITVWVWLTIGDSVPPLVLGLLSSVVCRLTGSVIFGILTYWVVIGWSLSNLFVNHPPRGYPTGPPRRT